MRWTTLAFVALCVLSTVTVVLGECPNGCSGNGDCMNKDMCNCYKNYQGNDCADRTCMFGRAHVDTPKGDIDMDQDQFSPGWLLADSQQDPAQTYEYFNPDALADEAHFYMECSNKGICERATGLCACFDGFEGNGCQRTTCPGKCNDHGTCESMRELASKNGGTLFGMEGTVGAVAYDLWDANSTYGCRCDPWFFGPDCNKRNCKVGVDPMYKSAGAPRHETFVIHAYKAAALVVGDGAYIRLRLFDYYGESFITERIALTGTVADDAAAVAAAITRVPNQTYRKVECSPMGLVASDFEFFKSVLPGAFGVSITCQLTENPGKLRIPEIAANHIVDAVVVTTSMQGEDTDLFPIKSAFVISAIDATGLIITLTATSPDSSGLDGKLIKIGNHIVETTAGTGTTLNLRYPLLHPIGTNPSIYTMDPAGLVTLAASKLVDVDVPVGSSKLIFSTAIAAGELAKGDLIFLENAFYYIQGFSDNYAPDAVVPILIPTEFYAWLDKPFGGKAADGDGLLIADLANPMKVPLPTDTKGYQYVSECAGRGMCGYDTGICTCFKGYTNDNCDTQNILAL